MILMKSKKAVLELNFSVFVIASLCIITLIFGMILLYKLSTNLEDVTGQKLIEKSASKTLPLIKTSVYPEKAVKGTNFEITLQLNQNDSQGIVLAKATIGNNIIVFYDDGTHGDYSAGDGLYSGRFDSSSSEEGILSGDIVLTRYGIDLAYPKSISFEIVPEKCSSILTYGDSDDKVDIALIGAGYTDLEDFKSDTKKYLDFEDENHGLFSFSPFKENIKKFNFYRINELYTLNDLKCTVGCHGVDSMICCDSPALSRAAAQCPSYDQIILLVNDDKFCGSSSGIFSKICTGNKNDIRILVHEFGHAFGGLGDEYSYAVYPNMEDTSKDYNFPNCVTDCSQWPRGIEAGCFQSCGYPKYNRASDHDCIMNDYVDSFCSVCSGYISKLLDNYPPGGISDPKEKLAPPVGKQYMAELNYNLGKITLNHLYVSPGKASDKIIERGDYNAKIISKNNNLLSSFKLDIPNKIFPFYDKNSTDRPSIIELKELNYTLNLPYFDEAENIEIYNENESKILDINVSYFAGTCGNGICEDYENYLGCPTDCNQNNDNICTPEKDGVCDKKCGNLDSDCRAYIWIYVFAVAIFIVITLLVIYLLRKIRQR